MQSMTWSDIGGGSQSFECAFARGALFGAVKQRRYADHLDALGFPGQSRWDPHAGEVELRGHVFRAEQIGSFDGQSWLWTWANEHLRVADDRTTRSRRMRDDVGPREGIAAFGAPMIEAADERIPHMMASLALAHLDVEGFYIANESQVYVMLPSQVPAARRSVLDELRDAIDVLKSDAVMPLDLCAALPFAAGRLELAIEERAGALIVRDGGGELSIDVASANRRRMAVCFLPPKGELRHVLELLAAPGAPAFEPDADGAIARGEGWVVHVRVDSSLAGVMREANALPADVDRARKCATVVHVEAWADPSLEDALVPYGGTWTPASMMVAPIGKMPPRAIDVCERLNRVGGALVYDRMLRNFYPEA